MMSRTRSTIRFASLAMTVLLCGAAAEAQLVPVLSYDADGGTGAGTPAVLANGTAIIDQSSAGNNGVTTNGVNGSGTGLVSTVEDDPFNVHGELSFSFDGSSARIVSSAIDLLTDDLIAAAGGYTMEAWIKIDDDVNNGQIRSIMSFAGTDGLNLNINSGDSDNLVVIHERGGTAFQAGDIGDSQWRHVVLRLDTSLDPDGAANSTPGGPSGGVHGLEGIASMSVDGALVGDSPFTLNIGDFGDTLDRTIAVGGHPQGFGTTEFTGLLYNPSVSLGVDDSVGFIVLDVNRTTGEVSMAHLGGPVEIDFYRIDSEGESLEPSLWNSLDDQDLDEGGAALGDYNEDNITDAADYTVWRDNLGTATDLPNEGATEGSVTQEDYDVWRENYGSTGGGGSWMEAGTPSFTTVGETNLTGGSVFSDGRTVSLGNLFFLSDGTIEDLQFTYRLAGDDTDRIGLVRYFDGAAASFGAPAPEPATAALLLLGVCVSRSGRMRDAA